MITYNGTSYFLNLIDTNALSEIIKNRKNERTNYFEKVCTGNNIPCITIWSILELRKSNYLYPKFIELFSVFPFCILKPYTNIIKEEINNYPNPALIDPILFTFNPFSSKETQLKRVLENLFSTPEIKQSELNWDKKWKQEVLKSILSLKHNFKPKGLNFNANDANNFIQQGVPQYLMAQYPEWAKITFRNNNIINIDAFPSIKMLFYTVFYRFYAENRNPETQDVYDLMINFIAPYVDSAIVENFQAEIFRKVKKRDKFLQAFGIFTVQDLR